MNHPITLQRHTLLLTLHGRKAPGLLTVRASLVDRVYSKSSEFCVPFDPDPELSKEFIYWDPDDRDDFLARFCHSAKKLAQASLPRLPRRETLDRFWRTLTMNTTMSVGDELNQAKNIPRPEYRATHGYSMRWLAKRRTEEFPSETLPGWLKQSWRYAAC